MKSVIYFHFKTWCGNICQAKIRATPYMNIDAPPPDLLRIDALLWSCSPTSRLILPPQARLASVHVAAAVTIDVPPHRKQESAAKRPVSESPLCLLSHYSAAVLLEDTEGQRRLNSSVEYSLETNQEKPQNNNPCPPPWFIVILFHIFLWLLTHSERVVAA